MPIELRSGTGVSSHMFEVVIEGVTPIHLWANKVSATDNVQDVIEHGAGEHGQTHATPGLAQPGKLHVTRDWTNTPELLNWYKSTLQGSTKYTTVTVVRYETSALGRKKINETTYQRCWPVKWKGPDLNAKSNSIAIESLELVYDRVEIK